MTYGTVNAETLTTSSPGGVLGAGNASIMKNRIINGAFQISQYNGTSATTPSSDVYVIDRFRPATSQASKLQWQQNKGSVTPPAGFSTYLGASVASTATIGAGDLFGFVQIIEGNNCADLGWGTANAKTVTLSFQVYSSETGTFGGTVNSVAGSYSYPFSYTISSANTWTPISITIAGPTAGTWVTSNAGNIQVFWGFGVGSTYGSGTAGAWVASTVLAPTGAKNIMGTSGATFYITGVQLEVGSSATGFEYRQYGQELLLCYRYFQKWMDNAGVGSIPYIGTAGGGTTGIEGPFVLKTSMRSTPSFSISNLLAYDGGASTYSVSSVPVYSNATDCPRIGLTGATGLTAYRMYYVISANSSAYITASAEL